MPWCIFKHTRFICRFATIWLNYLHKILLHCDMYRGFELRTQSLFIPVTFSVRIEQYMGPHFFFPQPRNGKHVAVLMKVSDPSTSHSAIHRPNTGRQSQPEKLKVLQKKYSKVDPGFRRKLRSGGICSTSPPFQCAATPSGLLTAKHTHSERQSNTAQHNIHPQK